MSVTQFTSESRGQYTAKGYSAASATSPLVPTVISRRDPRDHDVQIEILFCGICHSDLHQVRNEWSVMPTVYPCIPGHEIVGRVTKVGSAVTKFKPGDLLQWDAWLILTDRVPIAKLVLNNIALT
jgi:Zn-dependent alcohol dehydrogenases